MRGIICSLALLMLAVSPSFTSVLAQDFISRTVSLSPESSEYLASTQIHNFAEAVASLGDLDGDGVNDIAVASLGFQDIIETKQPGIRVLFLNSDGSIKSTTEIETGIDNLHSENFAADIAQIGDLDGDGVPELAVGAPQAKNASDIITGTVYILSVSYTHLTLPTICSV